MTDINTAQNKILDAIRNLYFDYDDSPELREALARIQRKAKELKKGVRQALEHNHPVAGRGSCK